MIIAVSPGRYEFSKLFSFSTFKIAFDIASTLSNKAPGFGFDCELFVHGALDFFHGLSHNQYLFVLKIAFFLCGEDFGPELILDLASVTRSILTERSRQVVMKP